MNSYKKFLFVRHPFERLLSAYRDKLEGQVPKKEIKFQKHLLQDSGGKGPPHPITFPNFVDYLLKHGREIMNKKGYLTDHFALFVDISHPCFIEYDYIGHMETLEIDAEYVLKEWGAPSSMQYPIQESKKTNSKINDYFERLKQTQIDQLYDLFWPDFEMFGYSTNLTRGSYNLRDNNLRD